MATFANYFKETRPQFLLLSLVLVFQGIALAHYFAVEINWLWAVITLIGVVLAHTGVNVLNDFWDSGNGIDATTTQTPFSGGSGIVRDGIISQKAALTFGLLVTLAALLCGLYLCWQSGWHLIGYILIGGLAVLFYNTLLAKLMLGEIVAGLALGTLVILGTFAVQRDFIDSTLIWLAIPAGLLTLNLLLLNEIPDAAADKMGGRFHWVIVFGRQGALVAYTLSVLATFGLIALSPILLDITRWSWLGLLGLIPAFVAVTGAFKAGDDLEKLVPALGANVMMVLVTDLLLGIAYFVG
ncbi:MAG: prenyltransferase [Candidatus Delongbacteria bacterium]|nr:prenyltransferase [Candidatus Delongbacteria bacterium]